MARHPEDFRAGGVSLLLLTALIFGACTGKDATPPAQTTRQTTAQTAQTAPPATAAPVADDAPLVSAEGLRVTLADFEHALRLSVAMAPPRELARVAEVGYERAMRERAAMPSIQHSTTRFVSLMVLARKLAAERKLVPTAAQIDAALAGNPALARWASGAVAVGDGREVALSQVGLTPADLRVIAADLAIRDALTAQLMGQINDEVLWDDYQRQHDSAVTLIVRVPNTPTSAELDAYLAAPANLKRIAAYHKEHARRFRTPSYVVVTRLTPQPDAAADALAQALKRVKAGESPEAVAAALKLKVEPNVRLLRAQDRAAYQAKVGESGVSRDHSGAYGWIVTDRIASKATALDGGVKREVAAELMRRTAPIPSRAALARKLHDKLGKLKLPVLSAGAPDQAAISAAKQQLSTPGADVFVTPAIPRRGQAFIPGIGRSLELFAAIFQLDAKHPTPPAPIFVEESLVSPRVLVRVKPDRAAFERDKAAFKADFERRARPNALERALDEELKKLKPTSDLGPIRARYGVARKP